MASNVERVEELLESLRHEGAVSAGDEAIGQAALTVAAALDRSNGDPLSAIAAASKELRLAVADLTEGRDGGDDDDDFFDGMPAPVRDAEESG